MANVERRAVRKVAGLTDQKIAKIIDDLRRLGPLGDMARASMRERNRSSLAAASS